MAFDPGRDVDQEREARRVRFRKAVFAEALDLLEATLGEILRIAVGDHAADEFVAEIADLAGAAEGRHRAAQAIRLGAAEPRRHHGDPHRLFLEERHAQGLAQHLA